jgi:hypothetical protein
MAYVVACGRRDAATVARWRKEAICQEDPLHAVGRQSRVPKSDDSGHRMTDQDRAIWQIDGGGHRGLDMVAADVVEVSPPYDPTGSTEIAAANAAYELVGCSR